MNKNIEHKIFKPDYSKSLKQDFFLNKTEWVAKNLLGKVFVRQYENKILAGIIVETEAYLAEGDLSSHSAIGLTKRNKPMFSAGGILYVYKIYGVHHCINIVTEEQGKGCAVLIRALEPLTEINKMMELRNQNILKNLCNGPGKLAKAFDFSTNDNYMSLFSKDLYIQTYQEINRFQVIETERIGISKSRNLLLRYYIDKNLYISCKKSTNITKKIAKL